MNKEKHLIKNPEKEIHELEISLNFAEKRLQKVWDILKDVGCEITYPLSLNFEIHNKKAESYEKALNKIQLYISYLEISENEKENINNIIYNAKNKYQDPDLS